MSKSLAASPDRQREIAEMVKNQLVTEERKPEEDGEKRGKKRQMIILLWLTGWLGRQTRRVLRASAGAVKRGGRK